MTLTFTAKNEDETIALGEKIGELLSKGDIIAMEGTLGAGKTTITKGIAKALGVIDHITSPTFCLISEYAGKMPLYHMDVYRLDGVEDFQGLGVDDMLYGDGVSIIEWSEKVKSELPKRTITLRLEPQSDGSRLITLENWEHGDIK